MMPTTHVTSVQIGLLTVLLLLAPSWGTVLADGSSTWQADGFGTFGARLSIDPPPEGLGNAHIDVRFGLPESGLIETPRVSIQVEVWFEGRWVPCCATGGFGSQDRRMGLILQVPTAGIDIDIETEPRDPWELDEEVVSANIRNIHRPLRVTIGAGTLRSDPSLITSTLTLSDGATLNSVETPRLVDYWVASDDDAVYVRPSARVVGPSVRALSSHTVETIGDTYTELGGNIGGVCEREGPPTWAKSIGTCSTHAEWAGPAGKRSFQIYAEAYSNSGVGNAHALKPDMPPFIEPGVDNALREYALSMLVVDMG